MFTSFSLSTFKVDRIAAEINYKKKERKKKKALSIFNQKETEFHWKSKILILSTVSNEHKN